MSFYHKSNSVVCFLFFKQKTAYEMRISDWSSDVCSSDLQAVLARIAREDVAETRRDDAADPEVGERPHRMFARRAAAEIAIGDEDPRVAAGRPVEDEIFAFAAVFVEAHLAEQMAPEARTPPRLHILRRTDHVGVDIVERQDRERVALGKHVAESVDHG